MTGGGNRRSGLTAGEFLDRNDFSADVRRAGGPSLRELSVATAGAGDDVAILHAIYGGSEAEFAKAARYELAAEQQERRHIFVRKFTALGRRKSR